MSAKPAVLYITDLYYQANNREYYKEDIYITSRLTNEFDIFICNPLHSAQFEDKVDLVVIRNSGPVIYYKEEYNCFRRRIIDKNIKCYNALSGEGDMLGKQYLLKLTRDSYPVIPTIDDVSEIKLLPPSELFIIKPKEGADSIGMRTLSADQLQSVTLRNELVQPYINFVYEVSFYFIDNDFQYALYAPDKKARWKLEEYKPSHEDLAFALSFIAWNTLTYGIQRVDACRTREGKLLLVELEDLNPFLSIDLVSNELREQFISNFKKALHTVI